MTNSRPLILVIEDEAPIRRFLKMTLLNHDYEFAEALSGREGLLKVGTERPDLIVLDLGLPDIDGLEVTRQIREWSPIPIIILSARGQEKDKIAALDMGADDYLTKPFGVGELLARIRVALRHADEVQSGQKESVVNFADIEIDLAKRRVVKNNDEIHLTPIEYKLLLVLVKHMDKVVTHNVILREVWGSAYSDETQYLRVFVAQLRRKLEDDAAHPKFLFTEAGVGYRLKSNL